MIIDNIKNLLFGIIVVLLLLTVCITVDYADETITANNLTAKQVCEKFNRSDVIIVDDTQDVGVAKLQKVVTEKPKYPIVSMWARPSVRCNLPYKWFHRSFLDYCPHCRRYGVLYDAHKWQARFEHEWTCRRCGADYDAVIGKEKYSWSKYYLRRA